MTDRNAILLTGTIGLVGALLTGLGEFLLHFDPNARFGSDYGFFLGIPDARTSLGHFVGVLSAPLYLIGCWHIHLMLRRANPGWSLAAFLVAAYGFVVGAAWLASRASVSGLVNAPDADVAHLVELYVVRYETLLQVVRAAVLVLSGVYVWLILTGRSYYPKWMAAMNPIVLIAASFLVYLLQPGIGKYLMPIALNVAFAIFFIASITIAIRKQV